MKKQNQENMRLYDGKNNDVAFSIIYIGTKRNKKRIRYAENIKLNGITILENSNEWYKERTNNYKQYLSDFIHNKLNLNFETKYHAPIIIEKNNHRIFCHVKEDNISEMTFLKFEVTILTNDENIEEYTGSIENYLENIINIKNNYNIYSMKRPKKKFKSFKNAIDYYLKKKKIKHNIFTTDNTILINDELDKYINKYLYRENLEKNLYVRKSQKNDSILFGTFLSKFGNLLFILQNQPNFDIKYEELITTLANSYDVIKEYILLNIYLKTNYMNIKIENEKTKVLKRYLKELIICKTLRTVLIDFSMGTVALIVNEFESYCSDISISKKLNAQIDAVAKEIKNRGTNISEFSENVIAKTSAEIYDKTIDKLK